MYVTTLRRYADKIMLPDSLCELSVIRLLIRLLIR
jgi:hypothetical protein